MLTDLADRRLSRLENQLEQLREDLHELDSKFSPEERSTLLQDSQETLDRAKKRRQVLERASDADKPDLYDRYVSAIDDLEVRLDGLHRVTGYIELHARQRAEDVETIDDIQSVCDEACDPLGISVTVLPVIWESYATLPLQPDGQEIYSLLLPRHANPRQYQPLIAHELGHAVFDRVERDPEYRNRVWEINEEWGGDDNEFADHWNSWYVEFFSDACGALTFGPAYAYALSDYLHTQNPFWINDEHPPRALRLEFVQRILREVLPDSAVNQTSPLFERIDAHLTNQERNKSEEYDSYVVDELLGLIETAAIDTVDNDLPEIITAVEAEQPIDDVDSSIRYRTKVNRRWYQNGG